MSASPVETMPASPVESTFAGLCTRVFWDVVDFPFPNGLDPDLIHQNMKSILEKMGFLGEVSIMAYVDNETFADELLDVYKKAGITILPFPLPQQGDKYARVHSMLLDIVLWAMENPANYFEPLNLMVISENIKKETDFLNALEALEDRYYNVLLALPQDLSSSELHTVSFNWLSTSLLDGGKPIDQSGTLQGLNHKRKSREDTVGFSDGLASLYLQDFGGSLITVFWDGQDCPTDYLKIGPALHEKGYHGDVLIRPYVDKDYGDDRWRKDYGEYRWRWVADRVLMYVNPLIRVVTEGDKYAKVTRMLLDLLFWAMNNDDVPQNFMLISKPDTKCNSVIQALEHRGFNLILGPSDKVALLCKSLPDGEKLINQSVKLQGRKVREESRKHALSPIVVFWLLEEDCPSNPELMWLNIRSTLRKKGYEDILSMTAYVDEGKFPNEMMDVYKKSGMRVKLIPEGHENAKIDRMSWDMIRWTDFEPSNFMVISKPFKDVMFDRLLEDFKRRGFNVLLELPDYMVTFGSSVWSAKSLLDGSCSAPIG